MLPSSIIRFCPPNDAEFCLTQHQLDKFLDGDNAVHWYNMLDYAVWESDNVSSETTPVVPTITPQLDLSSEWAEVIALFDVQQIERPKKARKTRSKAVEVVETKTNYRARVLEYVTVSGDYIPSKFRTAWKRSVYGMLFDITDHALKTTESWKVLYDVICEFLALDADTRCRMQYACRVSNMKVADLKQECKNSGLSGYGKMKKDELVTFILVNCNPHDRSPDRL